MLSFLMGVSLRDLAPQMLVAMQVVEEAFKDYGLDCIVTSGNDKTHSKKSLHYSGRALDFRTKHAGGLQRAILEKVKNRLTHLGFDVLLEDLGKDNEHLHVEYDPK